MRKRQSPQPLPLFKRLWLRSQTKALAYWQGSGAVVAAGLDQLNGYVNDPHAKDFLSNFSVPKKVYIALAVIALLTWLAHGRDNNA